MSSSVGHIVPKNWRPRAYPPRVAKGDGGFHYLWRGSDGTILLDGDDYMRFPSLKAATDYIEQEGLRGVIARRMPMGVR